jgi:hypothetical protein
MTIDMGPSVAHPRLGAYQSRVIGITATSSLLSLMDEGMQVVWQSLRPRNFMSEACVSAAEAAHPQLARIRIHPRSAGTKQAEVAIGEGGVIRLPP